MGYNLKSSYSSVDELQTRDRGVSILYGRAPDTLGGEIIPIKVDAAGSVIIGTGVTLSGQLFTLGKGIFDSTYVDPAPDPGTALIGLKRVGDATAIDVNLYAMLVQDSRMVFTGGALNVNTTANGTLLSSQTISVVAPTYTTFSGTGITAYNVRSAVNKSFVLLNTGANPVDIKAFVSMDNGSNYDIPLLPSTTVPAGGTTWVDENRAFTHFTFLLQRNTGDTTVVIKGFAQ